VSVVPGKPFPVDPAVDLRGMRATVMGLGRFSGGVETVRWLVSRGAEVTLTDLAAADALADSLGQIEGLPVRLALGGHREEDFTRADLVVASPAVPPESPYLAAAARAGVPLMTELSITMGLLPCRAVWVTGTCGKSTTTALLGEILGRAAIPCEVGGNIGRALIGRAAALDGDAVAVLEVSSFQLEWTARDGIRPALAVVTNVTPNHLDRHRTFDRYVEAKAAALPAEGHAVLNGDDPVCRERLAPLACREGLVLASLAEGEPGPAELDELRLLGDFNRMNALQALLAAELLGAGHDAAAAAFREFGGLPHRLEDLGVRGGVRGVNDSKATTPEAAVRALRALPGPVVLVAGGFERGAELEQLAAAIRERARALVLLGESAARVAEAVGPAGPETVLVESVEAAVRAGLRLSRPGDTLLLSPAHASWDMYASYEERGDRFRGAFDAV
jgi:UDP-N-acetylmuramoylalanine--D-glutamate ligase